MTKGSGGSSERGGEGDGQEDRVDLSTSDRRRQARDTDRRAKASAKKVPAKKAIVARGSGSSTDPAFLERQAIAENIGRIALVWTHVEAVSHAILWGAIDVHRPREDTRPLTLGQSIDWVWDTTQELLSHKPGSEELVEWFVPWRARAGEGKRKRNEAVHSWWLPTGQAVDPYRVLDLWGRKAKKGIRDDAIPGGAATLLEWIDEISSISEDQLDWMKNVLLPFLLAVKRPDD
jgi:hypothetical protein